MSRVSVLNDNVMVTAERVFKPVTQFIRGNPLVSTSLVGLSAAGIAAGVATTRRRKTTKKKKSSKKKATRRKKKTSRRCCRRRKVRRTPRTAGKGKDRSTRRIRHTKNGQPYVILRSGKARFIKRSSARRSRRLKGGRY